VTVELRGQGDVNHPLASLDCQALIDYLIHSARSPASRRPCPSCPTRPHRWRLSNPWPRPSAACWCSPRCREYLEAGQQIAEIIDPIADRVTPFIAPPPG
jgi:predicted deacylase